MPRRADTKNPDDGSGLEESLTLEITVPCGHDGARQALAELRWILDADGQRIRRILISGGERFDGDHARSHDAQGLVGWISGSLVAKALAIMRVGRSLLHGRGFLVLLLCTAAPFTAQLKCLRRVSCQHEQVHDGQE